MNIFLIALLISSRRIIYQLLSLIKDEKRFIPKGNLVEFGGTQLHVHIEGNVDPTVIFDCGHGICLVSSDCSLVHPQISKGARTIVYDRAGIRLGDKSKKPRTSAQIVGEIHTSKVKCKIKCNSSKTSHLCILFQKLSLYIK